MVTNTMVIAQRSPAQQSDDLGQHMQQVATALLGEPNRSLSKKKNELRFGTRGSLSVDLVKGTFYDHENQSGGGVLSLIERERGLSGKDAVDFMRGIGCQVGEQRGNNGGGHTSVAKLQKAIPEKPARGELVLKSDYTDESGTLLYQVLKYDNPRTYKQRRPNGHGGWIWNLDDTRRVLYRLPGLLQYPDATTFLCEGEKDANRVIEDLGHCATTVASGKWTDDCVTPLVGRDVVILQDNDQAGAKRAQDAARQLHGKAKTVRVVLLPDLPEKGDVSDWLDADPQRAERFVEVCFDTPLWTPPEEEDEKPGDEERVSKPWVWIDMSNWDSEPVPDQEWTVLNRIPERQCVLFSGEGGGGKGMVTLHEAAAHVLARDWLGSMPKPGPAFYIDAEDEGAVIHRRLAAIANHYDVKFSDLIAGGLHVMSLAGDDAVLATVGRNGRVEPTERYQQLVEEAGDIKPRMIGIASCSNVFTGDENSRPQVQQFIGLLTRMAIVANGSVVLISHPSLTGINTDTGLSGSTAWHNAVRARFYLKGTKPESGEQPDDDLREIVFKKNQYGPKDEAIPLRYANGMFLPVAGAGSLDRAARSAKAEELFLTLLAKFTKRNEKISSKVGAHAYAPTTFAGEPEAKTARIKKDDFKDAMGRLFDANKIHLEQYGPPSKDTWKLVTGGKP